MNYLNKIFTFIISFLLMIVPVFALEFDVTVDEEIRKNYNPSKLELENLPPLPKTESVQPFTNIPKTVTTPPKSQLIPATSKPLVTNIDKSTAIKIKKGTKFKVVSHQGVSDATATGTRISFVSTSPVTQRYVTIPQGTIFYGEVVDSHLPQYSGNGGLIELKIDSVVHKGSTYGVNAKVTKVNGRKIFINNIKGQRKYIKNTVTQVNKGQNFYKKTRRFSAKLADNPIGIVVASVPTLVGMGVYAINFAGSPLISLFSKGGRVSIPSGTEFEIKLLNDAFLH